MTDNSSREDFNTAVQESFTTLVNGGIIVYPTDTVWGLGCDATDAAAVAKIFTSKARSTAKSLVILVSDLAMLAAYVKSIPDAATLEINKAEKPTTIIYAHKHGLAPNAIANDNTIAVRITQHDFCLNLIEKFGKPIISTSANRTGDPTPLSFEEINPSILAASDYVVNLEREKKATAASRILRILKNGTIEVIRD